MESVVLKEVTVLGILGNRQLKNNMRLESEIYQPHKISSMDGGGWPADWEGRTLLALVRLMEVTHREPSYLREVLQKIYNNFNEKGYLSHILPEGDADEQQLSGHNWLLRGLLEYYRLTGNRTAFEAAKRMVENLYIPLIGAYKKYPILPGQRKLEGSYGGTLTGEYINHWYVSTDIGCAYMSLDSLSLAYRYLKTPELKTLLEEMIETFAQIDFLGTSMQTHASLSAVRGILCFYQDARNEEYLTFAKKLFQLYCDHGMTANYANHNWFNRPSWTEPCAIVDSYMAAMELYRITEDIAYFEMAQNIYLNALSHAQRFNGGFGCDNCVGAGTPFITATDYGSNTSESIDASWCCSMRGGEGVAEIARSIAMEKNGILHIGLYNPGEILWQEGRIELKTGYPLNGSVKLILHHVQAVRQIALFIPSYCRSYRITVDKDAQDAPAQNGFAFVNVSENSVIELTFDIPLLITEAPGTQTLNGYKLIRRGFQILGLVTDEEEAIDAKALKSTENGGAEINGRQLTPITDIHTISMVDMLKYKKQVLFQIKE